ncbi:lanthionine synthetase LanC family protein [uncultured Kordia sp.]|uniref:lanthionine synthetase LanC family protein n=1 Tax=uncultured Kordia sp. TaxID=507699 RepID=UPI002638A0FF|nr:lanthionine synthetase LanC family protein [uncultured Kordia sp.]
MTTKDNLSAFILQKLQEHSNTTNVGILNGLAGESLYHFYRSELLDEDASYDTAVLKLQQVIEIMSSGQVHTTFYNGLAGIGWFICHLNEAEIAEIDIEDFLDTSVDTLLYEDMIQFLNMNLYDFFYGATGICFYFLKRFITTQNPALKETYKTYITQFLFYIEYRSITDVHGKYWKQHSYPFENDQGRYQLSAANNISGLMLVLTEIAKIADFNPVCLPLLKTSSSWLLYQLETEESIRMDQAYCLWKAGKVLENDSLQAKAIQFLKQTTDYLSQENSISLSKFVLIYQSIGHETNDAFFTEKATESFQIMKEQLAQEDVKDTSIWKGYAGIGLTDLSVKFNLTTHWEACMLI